MSGVKGKSGGARPRSGRLQTRILLSKESAQELAIIVKQRRNINPNVSPENIVSQWIHEHWLELDAQYQKNAS